MDINQVMREVHEIATEKGWWEEGKDNSFATQIANFHGEISEAWEEWRKGRGYTEVYYKHVDDGNECDDHSFHEVEGNETELKPEGIPIELADEIIRILDTCANYGIDIEAAIKEKMAYNRSRPYRHGNKLA